MAYSVQRAREPLTARAPSVSPHPPPPTRGRRAHMHLWRVVAGCVARRRVRLVGAAWLMEARGAPRAARAVCRGAALAAWRAAARDGEPRAAPGGGGGLARRGGGAA
eukprot:5436823-Prymnesium_polylepis.2